MHGNSCGKFWRLCRRGGRRKAAKGFHWICVKLLSLCAASRFGKPRSFFEKVLIVAVRRCHCGVLIRGLRNLETSCDRVRVVTFCVVQKVTKQHTLGRAKSCRGQVFVRRRPPKQGELRTDVSKATMFQGDGEALRPTIQSSAGSDFAKLSGGSCRNRFCLQNGGKKALNRCERSTVVQTQD